jgi:hypothetical protein
MYILDTTTTVEHKAVFHEIYPRPLGNLQPSSRPNKIGAISKRNGDVSWKDVVVDGHMRRLIDY